MSRHAILTSEEHRNLRVQTGSSAELGDEVMSCFTVPSEFRSLQHNYPILFRRDDTTGAFSALALLGFENGENLFLAGDRWEADYKPMALSIQPFLVGRSVHADGPGQIHVDLDHPRIANSDEGVLVFDSTGNPTPYLERVSEMLGDLDEGFRASTAFFAALERYNLLEPFFLDVTLRNGASHRMVGYHLINEEKLAALEPSSIGELHREGHLQPIFMAMASLSSLANLIERKNRAQAHG